MNHASKQPWHRRYRPEEVHEKIQTALHHAHRAHWVARLWARDASLWSDDVAVQRQISERLGWLGLPRWGRARIEEMESYATAVVAHGINRCVWLGMGGASLAARAVSSLSQLPSPSGASAQHALRLSVCDHNHPQAIRALRDELDLGRTLFIVASKSGTTLETECLMRYFYEEVQRAGLAPAPLFTAVTDRGSALDAEAKARGFHRIFYNPPDVGGRYGALSYSGLLAAALRGHSVAQMLADATAAAEECRVTDIDGNAWLHVGLALAVCARCGYNKMVLRLPPRLHALAPWIEQLIAESTGKDDTGLVPILASDLPSDDAAEDKNDAEAHALPAALGSYCRVTVEDDKESDAQSCKQSAMSFFISDDDVPCIRWRTAAPGAEFFRWQFVTAVAGAGLAVNPFDEPGVALNKKLTRAWLEQNASPPRPGATADKTLLQDVHASALRINEGILCYGAPRTGNAPLTLDTLLHAHFARLQSEQYLALLAHLRPGVLPVSLVHKLRCLAARHGCLFTICQAPGYLHSTGQLHKDGPPGCFLLLSDRVAREDVTIPAQSFSFADLHEAQAHADFMALQQGRRTVLHLQMASDSLGDNLTELEATVARLTEEL